MYLSRLRFNRNAVRDPRYARIAMGPYQIHALLWEMFADDTINERDYLYRVDESSGAPVVYALSARPPICERTIWDVETKPFEPKIHAGQTLSFSLRINPVVTRSTPREDGEEGGKRHCVCHRHDVVMDMKRKMREAGSDPSFSQAEIVQETGAAWLLQRAEKAGFSCNHGSIIAGGYRQLRFIQRKKGKNNPVSISVLDISGHLQVTEPDVFLSAIKKGFGPAKGFGCGLMMIRPV